MRDTSKCKTMVASDYMTPEQERAFRDMWGKTRAIDRAAISAPDWARHVDKDGTVYSVEALAEEWIQAGRDDEGFNERELQILLAPSLVMLRIAAAIEERVNAGELSPLIDLGEDAA